MPDSLVELVVLSTEDKDKIIDFIRAKNGSIVNLTPLKRSLEDAFIGMVHDSDNE